MATFLSAGARIAPGLGLALGLALAGQYLSVVIGHDWLGLAKSPVSPIMLAILLGIAIRNTVGITPLLERGIRFALQRVLKVGIALLGIRLSLGFVGQVGMSSVPIILGCIVSALLVVTLLSRRLGLSLRLGSLIAVGTSICGATAIVATAPAISARDEEVTYAVACVTVFGVVAMLGYPFLAHWLFDGDPLRAGLFLGTAVHETAQVAGAGLLYQQYFADPQVLDVATVTKLVRNVTMLAVIPLMAMLYHRKATAGGERPTLLSLVPLFVLGFLAMSVVRTVGDLGSPAFGVLPAADWHALVGTIKRLAEVFLAVAMAGVGLGTSIAGMREIGLKPFGVGLAAALLVGVVSIALIELLGPGVPAA